MKLPAITTLVSETAKSMAEPPHRLMMSPRMVTLLVPKSSMQVDEFVPSSSMRGTALIAPVALVFGCEPVCV